MQILKKEEIQEINGGFLAALAAFIAVFTLPKLLNDHRKEYNEWGRNQSQEYWDRNYPYDPNSKSCYDPNC